MESTLPGPAPGGVSQDTATGEREVEAAGMTADREVGVRAFATGAVLRQFLGIRLAPWREFPSRRRGTPRARIIRRP